MLACGYHWLTVWAQIRPDKMFDKHKETGDGHFGGHLSKVQNRI